MSAAPPSLRVTAINHVGVPANDLAVSTSFYERLGLERLPSFTFSDPVVWMAIGDQQLHLVQTDASPCPPAHVALVVDDFEAAFAFAELEGLRVRDIALFSQVARLPDGCAQMFVRDPSGNLVELLHPDARTVTEARVPELIDLAVIVAQDEAARSASLFRGATTPRSGSRSTMRAPDEVFAHHGRALGEANVDELLLDYAEDSILVTASAVWLGRTEIGRFFGQLLDELPEARWQALTTTVVDDVLFHEWAARSPKASVDDGVDTLVIRDGFIRAQTVRYTLRYNEDRRTA